MATNAPAPETSLKEDLGKARTELKSVPTPTPDPIPKGEPAGEGDTPTKAAPSTEVEDFIENATAEELEAIKADPRLSKIYKSMLRDYKGKTTSVADRQRELEAREAELREQEEETQQARELFDSIRDDPEKAIRDLAERRGMTVAAASKAVAAVETDQELIQLFGDDAAAVQPVFNSVVDKRVREALKPVVGWIQQEAERQGKAQVRTDIEAFRTELKEAGEDITPEIEAEMQELTKQIDPAPGLSHKDYIRLLYRAAAGAKSRQKVVKEVTDRQARALRERVPEEVPTGGVGPGTGITSDMNLRQALKVARKEVRAGR